MVSKIVLNMFFIHVVMLDMPWQSILLFWMNVHLVRGKKFNLIMTMVLLLRV
jgi:hypothetical protein